MPYKKAVFTVTVIYDENDFPGGYKPESLRAISMDNAWDNIAMGWRRAYPDEEIDSGDLSITIQNMDYKGKFFEYRKDDV